MSKSSTPFLVGKKAVLDALNKKTLIKQIWLFKKALVPYIPASFQSLVIVDAAFFAPYQNYNHQGFLALLDKIEYANLETVIKRGKKILMVDHIQDPQNFGALLRSANAFGFQYIIYPAERNAPLNLTVSKVSAGALKDLIFCRLSSLQAALEKLKKNGFWIYLAQAHQKNSPLLKTPFHLPLVLVLGNEEKGISKSLVKLGDLSLQIPIAAKMESLNVASAGAILMFLISQLSA